MYKFLHSYSLISLLVFLLAQSIHTSAQEGNPTGQQIIQRAIDSAGGEAKLSSLHSVEYITALNMPDDKVVSIAIKRKDFNKYFVSTLSIGHVNSTTIYNNGSAVIISNDSVKKITDPMKLEELQLQCYISIDYGYKKLGYKLTRVEDQKFQNFDCYTVVTESPLGRKTVNYYDKKTGRIIMIIYPNETKTIFIDSYQSEGITAPSRLLITDPQNNVSRSTLQRLSYNNKLDPYWFNLSQDGKYEAPETFKTGEFKYINVKESASFLREKDTHVETVNGQKLEYKIKWDSNNDYLLFRLTNPSAAATDDNIEYIKARITGWTNNRYYCQYISSAGVSGTCAFEKIK